MLTGVCPGIEGEALGELEGELELDDEDEEEELLLEEELEAVRCCWRCCCWRLLERDWLCWPAGGVDGAPPEEDGELVGGGDDVCCC
ncbi:MAG: hypothetical protein AAGA68_09420 [Pseudomonadota bacterium]